MYDGIANQEYLLRKLISLYSQEAMHIILLVLLPVTTRAFSDSKTDWTVVYPIPVPSLIILGQARAGTTDIFTKVQKNHPYFRTEFSNITTSYKEFRSFNFCRYMAQFPNHTCTPEILAKMLSCPSYVMGDSGEKQLPFKQLQMCEKWQSEHRGTGPLMTIDASPAYFRSYAEGTKFLQEFETNRRGTGRPIFLLLLREPVARMIALYNVWERTWGSHYFSTSLEKMLSLELRIFHSSTVRKLLPSVVHRHNDTISSYYKLKAIMKSQLDRFNVTRSRNSVNSGFLVDSLVLPQLLGWIKVAGSTSVQVKHRILIIQSEYYFKNPDKVYNDNIVPFINSRYKYLFKNAGSNTGVDEIQKNAFNPVRKATEYTNRSILSAALKNRLSAFFQSTQIGLMKYLHMLQDKGFIELVPRLLHKSDSWVWSADAVDLFVDNVSSL